MKAHELREMTLEELKIHHDSLIEELIGLRIKLAMRQIDNPLTVRHLKRDVARAKTVMREKVHGARPGEAPGASRES